MSMEISKKMYHEEVVLIQDMPQEKSTLEDLAIICAKKILIKNFPMVKEYRIHVHIHLYTDVFWGDVDGQVLEGAYAVKDSKMIIDLTVFTVSE